MTAGGNCQTFSSSTVISYSNTGDGAPKVYQETSEMRSAPGGVSWRASPLREGRIEWQPQKPWLLFLGLGCGRFVCPRLVWPGLWKGQLSVLCSAPSQIRETRRTVRDSDSGLEQMSIGHHIRDRAHILQRSRNHRTGDQEERQDYINLDESEPSFPLITFPASWPVATSPVPVN